MKKWFSIAWIGFVIFLPIIYNSYTIGGQSGKLGPGPTPATTQAGTAISFPTLTPSPTSTPLPTDTPTPPPTDTPTLPPTDTPTPLPTDTPTPLPTDTPTATGLPGPTPTGVPLDCTNPGFTNYAINCGAEDSPTDPSPWIQLPPAGPGSLRVNTFFPAYSGTNDFAFSDGTMSNATQALAFGECVDISQVGKMTSGTLVTFAGVYRAQLNPLRLTSVYVQMTAFADTSCSNEIGVISTSAPMSIFDHNWYSIGTSGAIPGGTNSVRLEAWHTYSSGTDIPTSAFWDNFLFYIGQ